MLFGAAFRPLASQNFGTCLLKLQEPLKPIFNENKTARTRKNVKPMRKSEVDVLNLPPNSPDLNPIALPVSEVLKRNDITTSGQPWIKKLEDKAVTNTKHWVALTPEDKKELDLPKPVVMAMDAAPEVQVQRTILILKLNDLHTMEQWQRFSNDDNKKQLQNAGIPKAVFDALNESMCAELMLPVFKYTDLVAFLRNEPYWSIDEAKNVCGRAAMVDSGCILTPQECNAICSNYQKLVEWSIKLLLSRWNNVKDEHFYNSNHLVKIEKYDDANQRQGHQFYVRYPITQDLVKLVKTAQAQTEFRQVCAMKSLNSLNLSPSIASTLTLTSIRRMAIPN
eukprot:PhF_6_TR43376/c1_g4_i5/m.66536